MDDLKFNSLKDLYNRILPALRTKKHELAKKGKKYITEKDIWEYLCTNYWSQSAYLSLAEMVDDILNLDDLELVNYLNQKNMRGNESI